MNVSATTYVTSQQIMDWYQYLGFDFDVIKGKAPMASTMAINDSGRLYLTLFTASDSTNPVKNTAGLGTGYLNNTFDGYRPFWTSIKTGESLNPYYDTPLTTAGLAQQQQQLAKDFNYTSVYRISTYPSFSKTVYAEDATIYNIRVKGTPDSNEVSTAPSTSVSTPAVTDTSKPATNGNYVSPSTFQIREIQGEQPWCAEYVQAAAINNLNKTMEPTSAITAQSIMQAEYPTLSLDTLKNTIGGPTISDGLKTLQTTYGVTADVVDRALTFSEVKQQIDNGNIVEMDGDNVNATDLSGTGDNVGHSVAIVGYVMPMDGNSTQVPYYEIWNPWWNQIVYVSSSSTTINLGGVTYKWDRSWYNWRKTTTASAPDSTVANQKMTGASGLNIQSKKPKFLSNQTSPAILSTKDDLFPPLHTTSPSLPMKPIQNTSNNFVSTTGALAQNLSANQNEQDKSSFMNDPMAAFGRPQTMIDLFSTGRTYWYAVSTNKSKIMLGINDAATTEANRATNGAGHFVNDFNSLTSDETSLVKSGIVTLSFAGIAAIAAIAAAVGIVITTTAIKAVSSVLGLYGIATSGPSLLHDVIAYQSDIKNLDNDFYDACKGI